VTSVPQRPRSASRDRLVADTDRLAYSWLLTKSERANEQTVLDELHPGDRAWSTGNHVRPLVHGASYFAELKERIEET
jgi:phosphatidylserine/phosphatidylglycerophosphate/cardiolipin synthase-like enzyme